MTIAIRGPKSILLPEALGGNAEVSGVIQALTRADVAGDATAQTRVTGLYNSSKLTIPLIKRFHGAGVFFDGIPIWFKFTSRGALNVAVPANFPNRTYDANTDPEGSPDIQVHTWTTWGYPAVQIGTDYYKTAQDSLSNPPGQPISTEFWAGEAGLVAITEEEYRVLPRE